MPKPGITRLLRLAATLLAASALLAALLWCGGASGSPRAERLRVAVVIMFVLASIWTGWRLGQDVPWQNVLSIVVVMAGVSVGVGALFTGLRLGWSLSPLSGFSNPQFLPAMLGGLVYFQVGISSRWAGKWLFPYCGRTASPGLVVLGFAGVFSFVTFLGLQLLADALADQPVGGIAGWRAGLLPLLRGVLSVSLLVIVSPWLIQKRPANPGPRAEGWTWLAVTGIVYCALLVWVIANAGNRLVAPG